MSSPFSHFKKSLIYEAERPIPAVRADLERIRGLDKLKERDKRRGTLLTKTGAIVLVGAFIALQFQPEMLTLLVVIGAAALVALVAGVIIVVMSSKLDVDDSRYEIVEQVTRMLEIDSPPDSPVAVRIDFRKHDDRSKLRREGKAGQFKARQWNVKYYVDPCVVIAGRFIDGVRYMCTVTQKVQNRRRWQRSSRGKRKLKTKVKASTEVLVALKFKPEKFHAIAEVGVRMREALKIPQSHAIKDFQIDDGRLSLRLVTAASNRSGQIDGSRSTDAIAAMFLGLYQGLNVARDLQKQGGEV